MKRVTSYLFVFSFLFFTSSATAETVSGNVTMKFDLSAHPGDKVAQLWIPYPMSDQDQTIMNIRVDSNAASSAVYSDKRFQTPMLYAKWDAGVKERKLTFSFDVTRKEIIRQNFPEKEVPWDPADYTLFLAPTRLGPLGGDVKKLAEKITAGKKSVLDKAKAIYDWSVENTYRNPKTRGCGKGDVCELLKDPGGKCTDISSIFVALSRAAGVPARETFGIRQGKKAGDDISQWQHCWAEFYLPGHGWVPVDPADVRKMMFRDDLALNDTKTAELRDYFWGGIDAYRIRLGTGRDLTLNPPQHGEAVNYLMYPFAQIGKKTLDWLAPESFSYVITYRPLKINK
ncbi:MAG: transglutaminase domain-containing protein [Proteobacteria bacterium]|nr:transglutaminase domain-containing protein [Pseudomonadota bacterium]